MTATLWMIAYGTPVDMSDEYLGMDEDTVIKCTKAFADTVVRVYGDQYLRTPNAKDMATLLAMNEARGWPGMLGSVDCMHWRWKNCPAAWQGQFTWHCHDPTILLEAVASEDLWIWHCYFGLPGSHNDINALQISHLFARLAGGTTRACNYMVNGHYDQGYYLADGI